MKDVYQRSMKALKPAGMSGRTQDAYMRSVRKLVEFYDKTPNKMTEDELEAYCLHRMHVDEWSPNTMKICYCGIHSSSSTSSNRIGTSSKSSRSNPKDGCPAYFPGMRSTSSSAMSKRSTIPHTRQRYIHAACDFKNAFFFKLRTSTQNA